MFRKLMLTGILGIGTVTGLAATPTTAEAGCRPARVPCRATCWHGYHHRVGFRCVAPRVIYRPVIVNPCP